MTGLISLKKYRHSWTLQEDTYLKELAHGKEKPNWNQITSTMNNKFPTKIRSTKQCRERYINYSYFTEDAGQLSKWSPQEINAIYFQFEKYGTSWSRIAQCLEGKSQNAVKNKFYGTLRKIVRKMNQIIKIQSKKKKKKLRYESVIRVIQAPDCFTNLAPDLKQESLEIRAKIFSLVKQTDRETSNEKTFSLIQAINRFNLITRSFRLKKSKREGDNDDGQASSQINPNSTDAVLKTNAMGVEQRSFKTLQEGCLKQKEKQKHKQSQKSVIQMKLPQSQQNMPFDKKNLIVGADHRLDDELSIYFCGMLSHECSPIDQYNLFVQVEPKFPL